MCVFVVIGWCLVWGFFVVVVVVVVVVLFLLLLGFSLLKILNSAIHKICLSQAKRKQEWCIIHFWLAFAI